MKRNFLTLIVVIFISLFFTACNNKPASQKVTNTTVTTKTTLNDMNGFHIKSQVVVKGNTIWGYSQKEYGAGFKWRQIIEMNPFLNAPGRIYYDTDRKQWIVIIKPGEVVKIGTETINPVYEVEETTTTTTTEPVANTNNIEWWGWLLIAMGVMLIGLLICLCCCPRWRRYCNDTTHVHIERHGNIDQSTNAAIVAADVERSYRFRERTAELMLSNPNLTRATMTENSNQSRDFTVVTEYQVR